MMLPVRVSGKDRRAIERHRQMQESRVAAHDAGFHWITRKIRGTAS